MTTIDHVMTKDVLTCSSSTPVSEAAKTMAEAGVGAVVLVDDEGVVVGLFTERDLLKRVVAAGLDPAATPIGTVATAEVSGVERGTTVRASAQVLEDRSCRHLPVVEDGKPVGIVSARDFFHHVAVGLEKLLEQEGYEKKLADGEDPYDHIGGGYGQ